MAESNRIPRTQHTCNILNSYNRTHFIPQEIYLFASSIRVTEKTCCGSPGTAPTLADIYYHLIGEGADLILSGDVEPTFVEPGRPSGAVSVQIKFKADTEDSTDAKLRRIQEAANKGEYNVVPTGHISLLGVAVACLQIAKINREI